MVGTFAVRARHTDMVRRSWVLRGREREQNGRAEIRKSPVLIRSGLWASGWASGLNNMVKYLVAQIWLFAFRHWEIYELTVGTPISAACWPSQLSLLFLDSPRAADTSWGQVGKIWSSLGRSGPGHMPPSWWDPTAPNPAPPLRPNHRHLFWWLRDEQVFGDRNLTVPPQEQPHAGSRTTLKAYMCACYKICFLPVVQL